MSVYNEDFESLLISFAQIAADFLDSDGIGRVNRVCWPISVTAEAGVARWPISLTVNRGDQVRMRIKVIKTGEEYAIS